MRIGLFSVSITILAVISAGANKAVAIAYNNSVKTSTENSLVRLTEIVSENIPIDSQPITISLNNQPMLMPVFYEGDYVLPMGEVLQITKSVESKKDENNYLEYKDAKYSLPNDPFHINETNCYNKLYSDYIITLNNHSDYKVEKSTQNNSTGYLYLLKDTDITFKGGR